MSVLSFEWNERKSQSNRNKHGVSFEEAQMVFLDENALIIHDPDHALEKERFVMLGISAKLRLLIVCHCFRKSDSVIRIISARKAQKAEHAQYAERCRP